MPRDDASRKIESLMKESLHLPPPYGHDFSLPWFDSVFVYRVWVCVSVCVVGTTQVQHLGLADAVKEAV